jgi:hypothetical protein
MLGRTGPDQHDRAVSARHQILNEPIPLISDIAGEDITLIDLASAFFVDEGFISPETAKFIQALNDIVVLADSLTSAIQGDGFIDLGGFDLKTGDLRNPSFLLSSFNLTPDKVKTPSISIEDQLQVKVGTFKSARDRFQSVDGTSDRGKFRIPLIDNPLSAFQLLLGKDVTLFQCESAQAQLRLQVRLYLPDTGLRDPTPVGPIPVFVGLTGGFSVSAQLAFGYDTTAFANSPSRKSRSICWTVFSSQISAMEKTCKSCLSPVISARSPKRASASSRSARRVAYRRRSAST